MPIPEVTIDDVISIAKKKAPARIEAQGRALDPFRKKIKFDRTSGNLDYIGIHKNIAANDEDDDWKIICIKRDANDAIEEIRIVKTSYDQRANY